MKVYLIISTHNGMKWVEKCFNSILNSSIPVKTCVIDNASTDDTVNFIKGNYPDVDLIVNEDDMGFGKANNVFLRKALEDDADYVFLMNQDAWVDKDTIEGLVRIHQQNPQYGIVSPIHLNGPGKAFDHKFAIYCSEKRCPGFMSDVYLNTAKDIYTIHFVNGAFWLISRECLKSVGLFDPLFVMYGEDIDYANRVRNKGFKIGITPAYRGYHDRQQRPPSVEHERHLRYIRNICILKDTSKNFAREFCKYFIASNGLFLRYLYKRQFASLMHEVKSSITIYRSVPQYLRSRKSCRTAGAYINV